MYTDQTGGTPRGTRSLGTRHLDVTPRRLAATHMPARTTQASRGSMLGAFYMNYSTLNNKAGTEIAECRGQS